MEGTTIKGYYGQSDNPCIILKVECTRIGGCWYCVEGSENVCFTYDPVERGVNVETLSDYDSLHNDVPVEDLEQLIEIIENH